MNYILVAKALKRPIPNIETVYLRYMNIICQNI